MIVNSDYPPFLADLYDREPGLGERSYDEQLRVRMESLFGVADFYSYNLRTLGHEAQDILVNNEPLQRAWAREHGFDAPSSSRARAMVESGVQRLRTIAGDAWWARLLPGTSTEPSWRLRILERQIEHLRPDVLLNQDIGMVRVDFLERLRAHIGLLVGQFASPTIPQGQDYTRYDLMLSSLPSLVEEFRRAGVRAELHRLGFDSRVLDRVPERPRTTEVSFVGQLSSVHLDRIHLLELMSEQTPLEVWGFGTELLSASSPILARHRGPAWGAGMYSILRRSRITLNMHGSVGPHAANMRLYEATGAGALLITDAKPDLREIFTPGEEVATYSSPEECRMLVEYYLQNPAEREAIARAGQQRTLKEHTYEHRMAELVEIVERRS